jgi:hypothetical protein
VSAADHDNTQTQLEDALVNIEGAQEVLRELAETRNDEVLAYLSNRLFDHHRAAHDAFCRIYKLHKYAPVPTADKE